jgi:mannose-6-phosphate isomerase
MFKYLSGQPLKLMRNRVWRTYTGGKLLDKWQGIEPACDGHYPEQWVASTVEAKNAKIRENEGLSYTVVDGKEILLKEIILSDPPAFLGEAHCSRYGENPAVLVKILDSSSRLLIQVHPDKKQAKNYFSSEFGKTEAWFILGTREIDGHKPYVFLGFNEGITRDKWVGLFEKQDVTGMLECLHKIEVTEGDTFLIRGGVPHAMGAGVFFAEIQEPTDLTIRAERKAPDGLILQDNQMHQGLGFERMFDCFSYEGMTFEHILSQCKVKVILEREQEDGKEFKIISYDDTPFFAMNKLEVNGQLDIENNGSFCIAVVIEGKGKIEYGDGEISIKASEELFVPAQTGAVSFISDLNDPMQILICRPPKA